MGNHYHILLELPDPTQLSKIVGNWQHVYAVRYHQRYDTAGRFFQSRFKSQAIEKEAYLLACGRYIEQNPVRADLCFHAWDWPWSSARFYVKNESDPLTVCDPLWQDSNSESYKKWLADRSPEDEQLFASARDIIGGAQFRRDLLRKSGRIVRRGKGRKPRGVI